MRAASVAPDTNATAAPTPASNLAKLKTAKLPDTAQIASDSTHASVPQRTVADRPYRLMSREATKAPIRYPAALMVFMKPAAEYDQPSESRMSGSTSEYAKRPMPSPTVGASESIRISRAGCAGGEGGTVAFTEFSGECWQARRRFHRRPAAMVSCHPRSAALALGAQRNGSSGPDFPGSSQASTSFFFVAVFLVAVKERRWPRQARSSRLHEGQYGDP